MKSRVKKWGNSLALRIPKPVAVQMGVGDDSPVVLVLRGRELALVPLERTQYRLSDLLSGVSKHNLHGRISIGTAGAGEA